MVGLGTLPLAVALVVLALQVRSTGSPTGPRAALDEVAASGAQLIGDVDTTMLDETGKQALVTHTEVIARRTSLARRAETLSRYAAGTLGIVIFAAAVVLVVTSLGLAGRWSRLVSAPIEELAYWVRRIERREALPPDSAHHGTPEFDELRTALRNMATALDEARRQELEQERLRAFRETARRVAHEMRGPLTAARLAIRQLAARDDDGSVTVLAEETERLERMAREFSDFGRLPEGPQADIDLAEMLENAVTATVPAEVEVTVELEGGLSVRGHYEPLRRAVQNLLSNAVEAGEGRTIEVVAARAGSDVRLSISDRGPGVPAELAASIFDPYVTTKKNGTGLGLALVKQTVTAHRGTVSVHQREHGGATFVITIPEQE
jgi:signal transduction histidine kinase